MRLEMEKILERVIQDDTDSVNENEDNIAEDSLHSSSLKTDLTFQEELQMQIQQEAKLLA